MNSCPAHLRDQAAERGDEPCQDPTDVLARADGRGALPDPLRASAELSKCARLTNVVTMSSRMAVRVSPGGAAVGGHLRGDGVAPGQLRHDLAPLGSDDVLSDRRRLQQVGGARRLGSGLQRPGPSHPPCLAGPLAGRRAASPHPASTVPPRAQTGDAPSIAAHRSCRRNRSRAVRDRGTMDRMTTYRKVHAA